MSLQDYNITPVIGNYVRIKIVYGIPSTDKMTIYGWKESTTSYTAIGNILITSGSIAFNTANDSVTPGNHRLRIRGSDYYNGGSFGVSFDIPNITGYIPSPIGSDANDATADVPPAGEPSQIPLYTILVAHLYYDYGKIGDITKWYITNRILYESTVGCYRGDSLVEVYDPNTKTTKNVKAEDVKTGDMVNSLFRGYVPVVASIVMFGNDKNWNLFKKDSLGQGKPFVDFYIKGMHPLFIDGKEIPACDVPERVLVDEKYGKVYTIVTDQREPIKINGLDVMTWIYDDFVDFADKKGISWTKL